VINAQHITKSYGNLQVLRGVTLEVRSGEIVAITGKSGAGKSTLLHILGTLDYPDSGSLTLNGIGVSRMANQELSAFRNHHVGFVFQFHYLLPEFSALENVCLPGWIAKRKEAAVRKDAAMLLDYLGLGNRMDHRPASLSGGEQQRVAVARALINKPSVVLADEPSGNLDQQSSQELHQLFLKLREDYGQTFVLVTHSSDLAGLSDRCLHMQDGQIVG